MAEGDIDAEFDSFTLRRRKIKLQWNHAAQNQNYFVRALEIGQELIQIPGTVDGKHLSFVKDTGADMILVREDIKKTKQYN